MRRSIMENNILGSAHQRLVGDMPEVISRTLTFWVEPARAFHQVAHRFGSVLLESETGAGGRRGRYSIICINPFGTLTTREGHTTLALGDSVSSGEESPLHVLSSILSTFAVPQSADSLFTGGAVGYLGYELRAFTEVGTISHPSDSELPDCWLGLYSGAAVFDHERKTILLNGRVLPGVSDPEPGLAELERVFTEAHICEPEVQSIVTGCRIDGISRGFTKQEYCAAVQRVKDYIAAGDVYQVNLSQRFVLPLSVDPWSVYLRLRETNPAPYAAFLNVGDFRVISSSPELFLSYDPADRVVETRPIKGTRPRSADSAEDALLAKELLVSEKDLAENVMIVDLERNDLGHVCEFGSVEVTELASIESYATVHHLVSTVTGRLRSECDAVDLITACFPGGSITGAPKVRAMEIIDEIEPVRRGVYTGSIGYIGFDGAVNLNIAIRTAVADSDTCSVHVGGGIVADSDPEMEYQETLDKGRAFFEVLG